MTRHSNVSCAQSRAIDAYAIDELGIPSLQLMETAGAGCVEAILERFPDSVTQVAAAAGNNGGDGFVIGRLLHQRGRPVRVHYLGDEEQMTVDTRANFKRILAIGVEVVPLQDPAALLTPINGQPPNLFVDALLGTGARGAPRGLMGDVVRLANDQTWQRVAVDIPTGLDGDSGEPHEPTLRADLTCTFVRAKQGFASESAKPFLGELNVLPIGIPEEAIEQVLANWNDA